MATITVEEREAIRDTARRLLADRSTEADVRRTMESESGYDPALWRQLGELGLLGLIVDEAHGGAGAGAMELEAVMEEMGAALLCGPFLSSSVLAASLLNALGDRGAQDRLLPSLADGSKIATVAITGPQGTWTQDGVAITAQEKRGAWTLDGPAFFVAHGQIANVLLVVARTDDGFAVFEVEAKAAGMHIDPLPTFDHTLRLANISLNNVAACKLNSTRPAWDAIEDALDVARVALAGEQAGAGAKVLAFTVDYTKNRFQFGRAIGGFQAIKHMAADLLLESESANSAARYAARALAESAPDAKAAISLAAFACADAFSTITATAIQMHGGIAFTWAHPAHLYLRRARADAQLFGTSNFHRERYLTELGAPA
ncbi:MAG: acyl-CoA dehydrogenase family protein [Proteobacteria bacterium]|nr:acyl-CoA dehydrogenase family protein [Pseudomonadota bacterium]